MRRGIQVPVLLILGSTATLQFGQVIASHLFHQASPTAVVWLRFGFAAAILLAVTRPRLRGRTRTDWGWALVFGLTFLCLNWSFYESMSRIPMGLAVTIEFIGPIAVAIIGSHHARDLLWVALAAVGVVLLGLEHGSLSWAGVAFSLLAAVAWASYILVNPQVSSRWSGIEGLAVAVTIAFAASTPFALGGDGLVDHGRWHPASYFGLGVAMALLTYVLPYSLELIALRRIEPGVFSILLSVEPAVAGLFGLAFLGQHLGWLQWVAMAFVMAAAIGATRRPADSEPARFEPVEPLAGA